MRDWETSCAYFQHMTRQRLARTTKIFYHFVDKTGDFITIGSWDVIICENFFQCSGISMQYNIIACRMPNQSLALPQCKFVEYTFDCIKMN